MAKRPCHLCNGREGGCEECDGTGERHSAGTTTASGATIMVHGSRPISEKTLAALELLSELAFIRTDEDRAHG